MLLSWWRDLVQLAQPKSKKTQSAKRRTMPRKFRTAMRVEQLEDRLVPTNGSASLFLNLQNLTSQLNTVTAAPSNTVPVYIDFDAISQGTQAGGIGGGTFYVLYDPAVLSISQSGAGLGSDIKLGSLLSGMSANYSLVPADGFSTGVVAIGLTHQGSTSVTGTPSGHLIELDFHVLPTAPLSRSTLLDLQPIFVDAGGDLNQTIMHDSGNVAYTLSPPLGRYGSISSTSSLTQAGALSPNTTVNPFNPNDTDAADAAIQTVSKTPSLAPTAANDTFSMAPNTPSFSPTMTVAGLANGVLGNDTATANGPMTALLTGSGVVTSTLMASSVGMVSAAENGFTATVTTTNSNNYQVGDEVTLAGASVSAYNGTFLVSSVLSNTQFTFQNTVLGLPGSAGGTVTNGTQTLYSRTTAHGTVALNANDGSLAYTPVAGYTGTDTFTYEAVDAVSNTASTTATVTIYVGGYLWIPQDLATGGVGSHIVVPVNILNPNPLNSGGLADAIIGINYDKTVFSLLGISTGTVNTPAGWGISANTNNPGQIIISTGAVGGASPITTTAQGSLALITFNVIGLPSTGTTSVVNLSAVNPQATSLDVTGIGIPVKMPLAVAPVDNTNFNGLPGLIDGLVSVIPTVDTTLTVGAAVGGSSVSTVTYGTPVTLTATVAAVGSTSVPSAGSVDFKDGTKDLGVVSTETISGNNAIFTLITTANQLQVTGSTHTITAAYSAPTSFNPSTGTLAGGLSITRAALTITARPNTKVFDGTTSSITTPTVSGLVGTDSVTGLAETYTDANVGTGKTLSVSPSYTINDGAGGNNYTVTTASNFAGVISPAAGKSLVSLDVGAGLTTITASPTGTVQVFIDFDNHTASGTSTGSNGSVAGGSFYVLYDPAVLSINPETGGSNGSVGSDIKLGSLVSSVPGNAYTLSPAAGFGTGVIAVSLNHNSSGAFASTSLTGHLIEIDFHVLQVATPGISSLLDLQSNFTDAGGAGHTTNIHDKGGLLYTLAPAPTQYAGLTSASSLTQTGAFKPTQFTPPDADTTDVSVQIVTGIPNLAPTTMPDNYSMAPNTTDFTSTMTETGLANGVLGNDTATTNGPMNAVLTSGVIGSTTLTPQSLSVSTASETGNVVTITTTSAGTFVPGAEATIAGVGSGYDGTYAIATVLSSTEFTYTALATNMANGNPGTVSLAATTVMTGNTANGTVWLNQSDGSFAFTPAAGFVGTDSFTYEAVDALSHTASGSTTVTINIGGYLSIPQTLQPVPLGDTVVVPVNLASGNPANSGGLTNATIGINYDTSKLSLPDGDTDVTEGTLNSAAGWTNFTVNTNTPGQIVITTSNTGGAAPLSSTAGGSLAFITFTLVGQPTGTSVVNISGLVPAVTELDVAGTGTGGNSIQLPFAIAPLDNTNFDGPPGATDGLITFPIGTSTTVHAQVGGTSVTTVTYGTPVTLTATVTAMSGSVAPTAGSVDFQDNGNDLGLVTTETVSGTNAIFTLVTTSTQLQVTGALHSITTIYTPGTPNFSPDATGNLAGGLDVTAAALTIKATTNTKTFDGTTSAAAIPTVLGLKGTDSVTGLSESYDTPSVGTGKTLSVAGGYTVNDGNGGANYAVSVVNDNTGAITGAAAGQFIVTILGSNSIVAGQSFVFMIQAADSMGNVLTNYTGPTTISFSTTPTDPQGNFPFTGQLSSSGVGFYQGTLKTAGNYTLTASAGGGAFAGTSAPFTVIHSYADHFKVTAPNATLTGASFNVTVTALDTFGNLVTNYSGAVRLTSTDPNPQLGTAYTFTTTGANADNGTHTFSASLFTPGNQTITATDTAATNPTITATSGTIATTGLVVSTVTPTATGFTATFNRAIMPNDLTLYGSNLTTVQDVTLRGAHVGPIHGTLLINPTNQSITFNATSSYLQLLNQVYDGTQSAVLPDDTYTITLLSGTGTNGFIDTLGEHLDGANNFGHANYVSAFATHFQANATPALGIPDIARGPDSNTPIKVPNDTAFGIPISLYQAANVTDVTFTLTYNPSLLSISGALQGSNSDATDPNATLVLTGNTPGLATFHYHDAAARSGDLVLGDIAATVPSSAVNLYKTKSLLQIGNIIINQGAVTGAVPANTILVNAYFGDVNGSAVVDGNDKLTANQVAIGQASGFDAFRLTDPVIVGDVANDLSLDAGDVTTLNLFELRLNPPQIPTPPTALATNDPNYLNPNNFISPNAADPTLNLVSGEASVVSGENNSPLTTNLSLSVMIDHPHPTGSTGMTEATLALTYDSTVLSVSPADITLGSIPSQGAGWQLTSVVDAATGQIGIEIYSLTPITATEAGSLVNIAFHVQNGTQAPATAVQLVNAVTAGSQPFATEVADAQGGLILSPGVDRFVIQTGVNTANLSAVVNNIMPAMVKTEIVDDLGAAPPEIIVALGSPENANSGRLVEFKEDAQPTTEIAGVHLNGSGLIISGLPTNGQVSAALPLSAPVVQIVSMPTVNGISVGNTVTQLTERLFSALGRRLDAPDLDWLSPSSSNQLSDALASPDWLTFSAETASPATAPNQDVAPDRAGALDKVFADTGDGAMDEFGDLGDY